MGLSGEVLTVAYDEEALAQYQVGYATTTRLIAGLTDTRLGNLGDVEWHPAMLLRPYAALRPQGTSAAQLRLLP